MEEQRRPQPETPRPTEPKESAEELFSGVVKIDTPKGPIVANIISARVFIGRELLEQGKIDTEGQYDYKETLVELGQFLDSLPAETVGLKSREMWHEWREKMIQEDGEDSVFHLLPENLTNGRRLLLRVARSLRHRGLRTKTALATTSSKELFLPHGIGEKSDTLINAMRNVAIAELVMKIQAPPQTQQ